MKLPILRDSSSETSTGVCGAAAAPAPTEDVEALIAEVEAGVLEEDPAVTLMRTSRPVVIGPKQLAKILRQSAKEAAEESVRRRIAEEDESESGAEAGGEPGAERGVPVFYLRRPKTRGDCKGGPRPCPWVSCRQHLYLDVEADDRGRLTRLRMNFPDIGPDELERLPATCVLDVADSMQLVDESPMGAEMTLETIGVFYNLTRERVRQVVEEAQRRSRLWLMDEDGPEEYRRRVANARSAP